MFLKIAEVQKIACAKITTFTVILNFNQLPPASQYTAKHFNFAGTSFRQLKITFIFAET